MWWAAGAALALALLLAGAIALWGRWDPYPWREYEAQHQAYDRPITTLVFDEFRSGDVEVSASASGRVEVERQLRWDQVKPTIAESWSGETFTVTHDCRERCSIRYLIKVPAAVAVRVQSTSGDVRIIGLSGDVRVKSTSGDITLTDIGSAKVEATAGSGEVDIAFAQVPQSVSVQTSSGDVTAMLPGDRTSYKVDVRTTSGDQKVTVDQSAQAGRAISVHATSGDVTIGYR